jgi:hypothetical protein
MKAGQDVGAFYSNIDYQLVPSLPADAMYFHSQYRQSAPNVANTGSKLNPDGKDNYVYVEARGRGHLMGVTLGVLQNTDGWMGEGDDMIFVDDESKPVINGTGRKITSSAAGISAAAMLDSVLASFLWRAADRES